MTIYPFKSFDGKKFKTYYKKKVWEKKIQMDMEKEYLGKNLYQELYLKDKLIDDLACTIAKLLNKLERKNK